MNGTFAVRPYRKPPGPVQCHQCQQLDMGRIIAVDIPDVCDVEDRIRAGLVKKRLLNLTSFFLLAARLS
ncbi:hypothetical protein J6590_009860 [Homalodisca vitripennis]|nr:hypothetical protein J6590_009860 [Homalodisca vitripennis]